MVGLGRGDPARRRRRALQLPRRVEAERRRRRRERRTIWPGCTRCWPRRTRSSGPAARRWPSTRRWRPARSCGAHPHLIVTSITPFGLEGPWRDKAATEFTLQAWSGAIVGLARGRPDRAPVFVGGQIGEWLSGVFGAIGTLAAVRRRESDGELVDVSMLEALAMCLTYYPVTFNDQLGRPMRRRRFVPTPGVGAARDGLVGLGCGTGQQWLDFCVMVEHPEWMEDPIALPRPHGAGADHRRLDRRAHRRRGARPGVGLPDPQRTDRQRLERHDVRAFRDAGHVRGQPAGRRGESATTLPAGGGAPSAARTGPTARRALDRRGVAQGARPVPRRTAAPRRRFRSRGCASWT